jgi:hypothetical protein
MPRLASLHPLERTAHPGPIAAIAVLIISEISILIEESCLAAIGTVAMLSLQEGINNTQLKGVIYGACLEDKEERLDAW